MSLLGGAHRSYEMITYVLGQKCCVITFIPTIYFTFSKLTLMTISLRIPKQKRYIAMTVISYQNYNI